VTIVLTVDDELWFPVGLKKKSLPSISSNRHLQSLDENSCHSTLKLFSFYIVVTHIHVLRCPASLRLFDFVLSKSGVGHLDGDSWSSTQSYLVQHRQLDLVANGDTSDMNVVVVKGKCYRAGLLYGPTPESVTRSGRRRAVSVFKENLVVTDLAAACLNFKIDFDCSTALKGSGIGHQRFRSQQPCANVFGGNGSSS
jgi:hypothetical protein